LGTEDKLKAVDQETREETMVSQLAAQLYTLREFTKTPADIAQTFKRVKKMGYDAVQCSALGPIDPAELAHLLKEEGLTCCATHVSYERMGKETQAVIDEHHLWGCRYTAIGGYFPKHEMSAALWRQFAADYSDLAKKFAGSGLSIGFHNHSHEMVKYDGATAMEILIETLHKLVWMEIDTYWITHGGGDPLQWIKRVAGRMPCVHLKDMAINAKREQFMAEVGEGNLNWPDILAACRSAGVQWYIVEQDICYRDQFESLAISLKNLNALGVR
jgi:sugar phosphate isomerase/epimerase